MKNSEVWKKFGHEIKGVIFFSIGIIMFLSIFRPASMGIVGKLIRNLALGMVGSVGAFIPIAVVIYSVAVLFQSVDKLFVERARNITILLVIISSLLQLGGMAYDEKNQYEDLFLSMTISMDAGMRGDIFSGGLIGGGISFILFSLVQYTGAFIILVSGIIVMLIILLQKGVQGLIIKLRFFIIKLWNDTRNINWKGFKEIHKKVQEEKKVEKEVKEIKSAKFREFLRDFFEFKKEKAEAPIENVENLQTEDIKNQETQDIQVVKEESETKDQENNQKDELIVTTNVVENDEIVVIEEKIDDLVIVDESNKKVENNIKEVINNDEEIKLEIPEFIKSDKNIIDNLVENLKFENNSVIKEKVNNDVQNLEKNKPFEFFEDQKIKDFNVSKVKDIIDKKIKNNVEYEYPSLDLLAKAEKVENNEVFDSESIRAKLEKVLNSFQVKASVVGVVKGPAVTRFEVHPGEGVKVAKILGLSDDIALNFASPGVRIEAPIPGKQAVGIEIPNECIKPVYLREIIESNYFKNSKSNLEVALGKNISGEAVTLDLAKMPHLLIAGATGSGKSVCLNSIIISILFKASPDKVKLIMIDPKVVELKCFDGIPHLLTPVVVDPKKAANALNWAVKEMLRRYQLFGDNGVRDIFGYNQITDVVENNEQLHQIVIIVDELADLMSVAHDEIENAICRLAQMARAAGMYLVIATQRPSVDVITGVIKSNIPSRIAFSVASQIDSRTILDQGGAEKLLGKGDMLYYPTGFQKPLRVQGAFVSNSEVVKIAEEVKKKYDSGYDESVVVEINKESSEKNIDDNGDSDELLPEAIKLIVESNQVSATFLQRKLKVGYARAARIIDQLEERGVISKNEHNGKPRQILITKEMLMSLDLGSD